MKTDSLDRHPEIDALNDEAEKLSRVDPAEMLKVAIRAKQHSEQTGYTPGLARALCNIGTAYWRMSNYGEALNLYQRALSSYEELHDDEWRMRVLLNIGLVHQSETKYDKALENFQDSLNICEQHNDLPGKAVVLANIGAVYHNLGRYERAMEFLLSALEIAEELNDRPRIAGIIGNISRTYIALGQYEPAFNYQQKSLEIYRHIGDKVGESRTLLNIGLNYERQKDYDTTLLYYYKAFEKFEEIHDKAYMAATLLNIGGVYTEIREFGLALDYLEKALHITEEIGDTRNHAIALTNTGNAYFRQGEYRMAAVYLERALSDARESGGLLALSDICRLLSDVYEALEQPALALQYFRQHTEAKEKLQNQDVQRSIAELRIRFEVEKSEKEKEIYRLRNVELANLLARVEDLNKHLVELDNEKNEFLGIVAHDLKNPLTGILMSVSLLQSYFDRMSSQERLRHLGSIEAATQRMSNIITRLLDIKALESGKIQLIPERFAPADVAEEIVDTFRKRAQMKELALSFEDNSGRSTIIADKGSSGEIFENLVSNAVKYSPPGASIQVSVEKTEDAVRFIVADEGPGFSEEDKQKMYGKFARLSARPTGGEDSTGLGLSIVKKLADTMGIRLGFESVVGDGTRFYVDFPADGFAEE